MDDDTAVGGPEVDEEQTEEDRGISAPTASRVLGV